MEWRVRNFIGDGWQLCCFVYCTTHSQRWTGDSSLLMTFAGCYDPPIATPLHRHFLPFWWHWECLWVGRRQYSRKSTHGWVLWLTLLDLLSKWLGTNMSLYCPFCKTWLRAKSSPLRPSRKHSEESNGQRPHALWQNLFSNLSGSGNQLARMQDSRVS